MKIGLIGPLYRVIPIAMPIAGGCIMLKKTIKRETIKDTKKTERIKLKFEIGENKNPNKIAIRYE